MDTDTDKELRRAKLTDAVNSIAFSHDGKTLAVATQGQDISLLDPATAKKSATIKGH